ncbi:MULTISPECIES: prolyl oligopeptidase family serine peptidase [unclassified Mucilaginibacter]|uniref:alpha/beta hydrolase family protein n=1 Tax=unclassified Mucilaginibacter TaxID=2617802 RepID=UPI002AC949B4|nr:MULTISPECIES: prolyl oligopeptidase family serine peptidase [unclassified Mucilaginibacter]MEB0262603.1 prolyl oligopeptidase family serine peptidase [Mucilaginibacter sp. 10I4]MEB0279222.1 prolyl oligopeptidase family serine peptidase [Mucilaginibacter sp. 10B2]MEB0300678.1 prolyl oligopeptidase family serine peptidase [Mucilaginibacter sp. 5C4]WPX23265.1 prolyl oligopeptidase family serine peptidase [Mucilaginibacter sp. 5C4]
MLGRLRSLLFVTVLLFACACKQNNVRQIPVNDFFKTPEKSFFKISPDGKYISYLKPYKDKQNIYIRSLADGTEQMATTFTDYSVRDYTWTYNNQIVFTQDIIAVDEFRIYTLDVATLKFKNLLNLDKARIRILNRNRQQPDVITVAMNKRDPVNFDVYRLNVKTGELKPYLLNPGNITKWYPDPNGNIRLVKVSDGVNESILYRADVNASFKSIIKSNFNDRVEPIAFTGDSDNFYALSNVNRDKTALVEINAKTGKENKVIYASDKADILDVGYSKIKRRIELVSWEEAKSQKYFLDKGIEKIYTDLSNKIKGNQLDIVDRDSAENKFIISGSNDKNPGSYFLYERNLNKLTKLADINPEINSAELSDMQPISFKASDGLMINGYLTIPKGKERKNLPVVVMPHDGIWGRNSWDYNAEVQFLANRGYAVFQVNFRGSAGYGKAFRTAGFKQVGGKIQQDITDGVKWLIANKIANPKKIAIFGGSFGGFSALYGVSFHPELYNCAIVKYGLINFFTYLKDAPPFFKPFLKMTYEMVGNPETDAEQLRAISPVFHTDKIKSPLLIFQGAKDPRANISELNQFVRELNKRNVPVIYRLKENERAYFKSEHNRMEMYAEIETFLNTNMQVKP